ncbi:glycosyltransferase family 4 protein [Streptomyces sp. NPDC059009]|uniref:glycosyltransferase family 4 protein n=1 Tax=Streptomyces sp. NPDC059009 TaxID=3346694 RepID=UPI0036B526A0
MKIAFLIHNAYGIGGTIRSAVNLSQALADRPDTEVEVVSVHRVADRPQLPFDPRVRLTSLIDMREESPSYEGEHELTRRPNTMFPDKGVDFGRLHYTALHDERITAWLARTDADIVIGTRPILNGYLARHGRPDCLLIGQEHLSLDAHSEQLRTDQNAAVRDLDAFVTVSEADAALYRDALSDAATTVRCIANAVPAPGVEASTLRSKVIVAAGRLVAVKRYDRLIDAFAEVADDHPEWTLRIHGRGPEEKKLRRRIDELGLYERAFLMGPVSPIETEWAKGAIAAVASDRESFGMTIVEAMHCGVPVVATDCPHGPAEIITDGTDGLLVPLDGGTTAYAAALARLMADDAERVRLGAAARLRAMAYEPRTIADHYVDLFRELYAARGTKLPSRSSAGGRPSLLSRLRSAVRRPTPEAPPAAPPAPARPIAYTRTSDEAALSVRLLSSSLPDGDAFDLVVRLRKDPKGREIRIPLPDTAQGTDPVAVLDPAGHDLPEGRWDCYVAHRGTRDAAHRHRLTSALAEQSRLVGHRPDVDDDGVRACIPYTTTDGFLALRTWRRATHAEVDGVTVDDEGVAVVASLLGQDAATLSGRARVVAVSRTSERYDFSVAVTELAPGRFAFTLPHTEVSARRSAEHDVWDLRLKLASPIAAPVRIGRIGGDVVDRKRTDRLPATRLPHPTREAIRVRPFFTVTNDLALSARDTGTAS